MTAIHIKRFGGLAPSMDPRNLPEDGAKTARNLDLRFGDFRPSKGMGASVQTVPAGTKSIHRTPSGAWLSSTLDVNYVNGQINDAASERVYLTGRSGYPEAWQDATYRRLGVPAPALKPTATVVAVDEFDSTDADAAQTAATNAVVAAILAADSVATLGNVYPTGEGTPVPDPDPLYASVALHIDFETLFSGHFVDKSPQQRGLTNQAGVSQSSAGAGPLGAPGGKAGVFAGGSAGGILFSEIKQDRSQPWCVEWSFTPDTTLDDIFILARDGNVREFAFTKSGGGWQVMGASSYGGSFLTQFGGRRAGGGAVAPSGVKTHVAIQNTGNEIKIYIDGVFIGQTPRGEGLELSHLCRSWWTTGNAFTGKVDEVRVTLGLRYTANFTAPSAPFSTAAVPTGFFVAHGDPLATGLPTNSALDTAYLVRLTLTGGSYVAVNPADEYLRSGSLGGAQVVYDGDPHWAVPVLGYRASGLSIAEATVQTVLDDVDDPANPGTDLLSPAQVTTLTPLIYALYRTDVGEASLLLAAVNAAQSALSGQLAAAGSTATAVATKITLLQSAVDALESYFSSMDAKIRAVLAANASDLFGSILSQVVTRELETRGYIVTYVTDWDEESAPSPVTDLLTLDQNDHVQIVAPTPPAGRNVVGWRLYRSSTTDRSAAFQLVVDEDATNAVLQDGAFAYFDIANLSHLDTAKQEELQEPCATLTWVEPPTNLKGLVGLPNGIMAGFFGKTVCFCEPYYPYAWPVEYQQTLEHDVVGLGVFGQTLVILTAGFPVYASGADSASMSLQKIENPQSCIAKRTIAVGDEGVFYASPDGLCLAGPQGVRVLTYQQFNKEDWAAAANSDSFGVYHDGSYYLLAEG